MPTKVRRGYFLKSTLAITRNGTLPYSLTVMALLSSTGSIVLPSLRMRSSIPSTFRSASSSRPWVICQRGLSGMCRRSQMMRRPRIGPTKKLSRQPMSAGRMSVLRKNMLATAPSAAPPQ
ncbi:Uncharacterised protein [Mycobacterium tuberculosis]|nr:Uncharacterised protein [Mycobacterium tuberculosis]